MIRERVGEKIEETRAADERGNRWLPAKRVRCIIRESARQRENLLAACVGTYPI